MEGIIKRNGALIILRNEPKIQYCKYDGLRECSDKCSMFEEINTDGKITGVFLNCTNPLVTISISKDERG
jgi:hypothetical protein